MSELAKIPPPLKEKLAQELGIPIVSAVPTEDGFVVVLDSVRSHQERVWENLQRVRNDGTVAWRASAPDLPDTFVSVRWEAGNLIGWTWGCYSVTLNPQTGQIEKSVFTK